MPSKQGFLGTFLFQSACSSNISSSISISLALTGLAEVPLQYCRGHSFAGRLQRYASVSARSYAVARVQHAACNSQTLLRREISLIQQQAYERPTQQQQQHKVPGPKHAHHSAYYRPTGMMQNDCMDGTHLTLTAVASKACGLKQQHQQGRQPQSASILDGRATAAAWISELQQQVMLLQPILGRPPGLAVVLVGNRPDSSLYVSRKAEACAQAGVSCTIVRLPASISQEELQQAVAAACADDKHDGVLVQLPLPPGLDEEGVMEHLDPKKDVDGFHPLNMGRMLMRGRTSRFVPATPLGVVELLSRSGLSPQGLSAVVVGDSNIVGTPLSGLLRDQGAATVTVCHRVSYQEWFEDQQQGVQSVRAEAAACLPRLPGPQPLQPFPASEAAAAAARIAYNRKGLAVGCDSSSSSSAHPAAPQAGGSMVMGEQPGDCSSSRSGFGRDPNGCSSSSSRRCRFQREQLPHITRTADLLVVAVGHAELVRKDWVKPGAIVVDVGINVLPGPTSEAQEEQQLQQATGQLQCANASLGGPSISTSGYAVNQGSSSGGVPWEVGYRVVGDVACEVSQVASALTPVPGGVGPMTIAAVIHNTLQAASYKAGVLAW